MDDDFIHIRLLDTNLSVRSGSRPEYIKKVIDYYKLKLSETEKRSPVQDPVKLSLLTSLNIIDELFKMEDDRGQKGGMCSKIGEEEIEGLTQKMIDSLDIILERN